MAVLRSQNCLRRRLYDESVALNPSVVSNVSPNRVFRRRPDKIGIGIGSLVRTASRIWIWFSDRRHIRKWSRGRVLNCRLQVRSRVRRFAERTARGPAICDGCCFVFLGGRHFSRSKAGDIQVAIR